MPEKTSEPKDIHDRLFKQLIESFFVEFIDLFFPQVSCLMDKKQIAFLQQEVITDVQDQEQHVVDILVKTRLADEEGIILIHIENQAQRRPDYNRKMFKYFARLHEKHQKKILPIVVYGHNTNLTETDNYQVAFSFMKVLEFKYLLLQLKKMPWRNYINSRNPVAAALIHKMNYAEKEKIAVKIEFTRMLVNMSLDVARSTLLTAFMEKYLTLTEQEEKIFETRVKEELTLEEVKEMEQITTSYHEKGRLKGRAEGKREGKLEGQMEGKVEKALEVAGKLLAMGMGVKKVMEITGLAKEDIERLAN